MASKKKGAAVKVEPKTEEPEEEPAPLRRSSRATRGSVKPIVDLVKDEVESGEDDEPEEKPAKRGSTRRESAAKKESAKKEPTRRQPVKRGPNKKPVVKLESEDAMNKTAERLEEANEEQAPDEQQDSHYYELSEKEMKEVNHAFDMNKLSDEDENLNTDGLRTAIRALGFEPRGDEIKKLMKMFSMGNKVNRDRFHKLMAHKYSSTPAMKNNDGSGGDEISRVFNLLDLDKSGFITLDNLRALAKELNEDISEEELIEMIQEADGDNNFKIDKYEFENIMKKTSLY